MRKQAIAWWKSKKPFKWTEEEHLKQWNVNCRGKEEHDLAEAVAEYVKSHSPRGDG